MEKNVNWLLSKLKSIWGSLSLISLETELTDFIVEFPNDGFRFALELKDSSRYSEEVARQYYYKLARAVYQQGAPRVPLVIALYDEAKDLLELGIVLSWHYGSPIVEERISFIEANADTSAKLLDLIKSADETIRTLSTTNCKVVKTIEVSNTFGNVTVKGEVMYLRDFSQKYRMNTSNTTNFKENFDRLVNGVPEVEYPSDQIDTLILEAFKKKYPEATCHSSLLLFNTDVRNLLLRTKHIPHTDTRIEVMPCIINGLDATLSGVEIISIPVDVYYKTPHNGIVPFQIYSTTINVENVQQYEKLRRELFTISTVSSYLRD